MTSTNTNYIAAASWIQALPEEHKEYGAADCIRLPRSMCRTERSGVRLLSNEALSFDD